MGTKATPSEFDYYTRALPDEPLFCLLARDPLAPAFVRLWADLHRADAVNTAKLADAVSTATEMETWRAANFPAI